MSAHFERGSVLFGQNRLEEAVQELKLAVLDDAECPYTHGLLAIALGRLERFEQAGEVAAKVIQLAPDIAYSHYVRSLVKVWRGDLAEARKSIEEAIRLDPEQADHFGALSRIEYEQGRWNETVTAAERGLALDPTEDTCLHFRSMALAKLGRRAEAEKDVSTLLENDPQDPHTHCARAWLYLETGEVARAKTHFLEALRLDPTSEEARYGLVSALKARHFVFSKTLQLLLYLERFRSMALLLAVLGIFVLIGVTDRITQANPALFVPFWIVKAVFFFAVVLVIAAQPVFDILLRLDREGRMALTEERLRATSINLICYVATAGVGIVWAWMGTGRFLVILWALLLLPAGIWIAHLTKSEWVRQRTMWVICLAAWLLPLSLILRVVSLFVVVKLKVDAFWLYQTATFLPLASVLLSSNADSLVTYFERRKPEKKS